MDSGHSSSMQSSSGGDEEYDSRPDPIPAVGLFNQMANRRPPPRLLRHHNHPPAFFDPPPNYNLHSNFVASPENSASNIMLNRDVLWPPAVAPPSTSARVTTSDLNCGTSSVGILSQFASSSSSTAAAPVQSSTQGNQAQTVPSAGAVVGESSQPRPRKRTRASRKAPTTVLTTDTTNFRAMVQEFTGIPAAPFGTPSPYSRRFDLLGSSTGGGSSLRTGTTTNPFGPSTQKLQISPPPPPPSNPNSLLTTTNLVENFAPSTNNNNNTNILSRSTNFNSSPNFDLHLPSNNNNGAGNPFFTFQSLISTQFSPLKYLSTDHQPGQGSLVATTNTCFSQDQQLLNDDIGCGGFPNIRSGSDDAIGLKNSEEGDDDDDDHNRGNYVNTSSNFDRVRGLENENTGTGKGGGTLDSWINRSS